MEIMKFKVGDRVRVREDLEVDKRYGSEFFVVDMKNHCGEVMEIEEVWNAGYILKEDGKDWVFTDEMLEPIEDPLVTKILERNNKPSIQDQLEENLLKLLGEDDKVNSPSHYTKGEIEVIDIIKQLIQGYEPFEAYLVGNTIKYLARANFKENKQRDLEKADWHINKLLEEQNK